MQIIHIQTTFQSIFGIVDEHGDVIQQRPVTLQTGPLTQEAFMQACVQLKQIRQQMEAQVATESTARQQSDEKPAAQHNQKSKDKKL